jgi:hypothetical protein
MSDWRGLCAEVLAFNNGEGCYNFSGLKPYDRDNAAFDAWQDIRQRLKSALAQPEPEGPTDEELAPPTLAQARAADLSTPAGRDVVRDFLASLGEGEEP